MNKQLAIAIVAILLTAVLLAPTVMAFAVRDGKSVQYSSHRGLNYITDNSVTASNQPYITLSNGIGEQEIGSRVNYYRAPVPVRTSNQAIVRGNEITSNHSIFRDNGMLKPKENTPRYSADGVRLWVFTISEDYAKRIAEMKNGSTGMPNCCKFKTSNLAIGESDGSVLIGDAPAPVKLITSELLKNGTLLHVVN